MIVGMLPCPRQPPAERELRPPLPPRGLHCPPEFQEVPRTTTEPTWAECLLRVQSILANRLGRHGDDAEELVEAMSLLGKAERQFRRDLAAARKRVPPQTPSRGGSRIVEYRIERVRGEQMLAEYRAANPEPYRCPRAIYRATAGVIKATAEPIAFTQIHKSVNRAVGEDQADYRTRVCVRFWEAKGILIHRRAKFTPKGRAASFAKVARDAWVETATKPFTPRPSSRR